MYAVLRFGLEFLRYDDTERGLLWGISTSQWISIILCMAVIAYEIQVYIVNRGRKI